LADERDILTKLVKEASDIVAVVGHYVALHPAGPTFKGLCPFHNDHRPSFDVDPRRQRYRCWSCGKFGDVFTFIQEFEKVGFVEARELLARRAGIDTSRFQRAPDPGRTRLLDALGWAADLYHQCLLDDPVAEDARRYLGERRLTGETVRKWTLGFAPASGDWLARQAAKAPAPLEVLIEAGLLAKRKEGPGCYDRFRERVMFPIRDVRGQVVGFGGRILPDSPLASRVAKYYNTSETPVFSKSDLIYGLDQARLAGQASGHFAVVEGYTDVLMAHQTGVANVVATMGTALTAKHVQQLRRFAGPSARVVLVYDADEGGQTGVDRALELFVSQNVELAIATLPAGMDPCDLLVTQGPEPFRAAIASAVDALDFKLDQVLSRSAGAGVEGSRRAVEAVLGILALVPDDAGSEAAVRRELILGRVARRLGLREETLRGRLTELRRARESRERERSGGEELEVRASGGAAVADPLERELIEVLLAEPELVAKAKAELEPEEVEHPGIRRMVVSLYELLDEGLTPDLDALRVRILDNPRLAAKALELQEVGRMHPDRQGWLTQILAVFRERREKRAKLALQGQLTAARDDAAAIELLRRLQGGLPSSL
jgi:DNA primase